MIALSVFLTHILRIQDPILRVKYINSPDFYPKLYQNLHAKVFKQNRKRILGNFWDLICVGGGLFKNFGSEGRGLLERGLNREGGLIEHLRQIHFKLHHNLLTFSVAFSQNLLMPSAYSLL